MTGIETALVGSAAAQGALASGAALSTTAAGAATAGLIGAGGSVTMAGLSSAFSFGSAALSLFGGNAEADAIEASSLRESTALRIQARDDRIEAEAEELRGKQESNDILQRLNETLAAQDVAFAARGLDVGFGDPVSVAKTTQRRGDMQLSTVRNDARLRALSRRRQATERLSAASAARLSGISAARSSRTKGVTSAVSRVASLADRRIARG